MGPAAVWAPGWVESDQASASPGIYLDFKKPLESVSVTSQLLWGSHCCYDAQPSYLLPAQTQRFCSQIVIGEASPSNMLSEGPHGAQGRMGGEAVPLCAMAEQLISADSPGRGNRFLPESTRPNGCHMQPNSLIPWHSAPPQTI